jgi:hypothetical protein
MYKIQGYYRCFPFPYKFILMLETNIYVNADIFLGKELHPCAPTSTWWPMSH